MKGKSKILLVMLTLLFVVAMSFSAYGADGQIKITQPDSFPVVIDQPGSYVLTSNITLSTDANGIVIDASNVTLDLNGHAIIGPGGSGSGNGIYAYSRHNITIKNGTVRDFGGSGIYFAGFYPPTNLPNFRVEDITAIHNGGHGIEASRSTITNCTVRYNGNYGIGGFYSTITNCTATHNGSHGIDACDSTITNCTANSNDFWGINAEDSTVIGCTANVNGNKSKPPNGDGEMGGGIYANFCTITNCTANRNKVYSYGIYATGSSVTNCTANNNANKGIRAGTSTVTNCTANSNGSGIDATGKCRIEGNNLRMNMGYGLSLWSSENYAIKNVASNNTSGNFHAVSGNYMPTTGDNRNYGF